MEQEKRIHLAHLTTAQYDAILNHCNSNIFVTDGQGLILYANDAAERALNCTFDKLRRMDVYQLREAGYTTHSSSADAIQSKRKSFAVYRNNLGEEIATTSIPVLNGEGQIELVVTRSDEVGSILAQQKELDRYRSLYQQMLTRSDIPSVTLIAEDPRMKEIVESLKKYAQSEATILLTGESGTGKEVLAGYIRQNSSRSMDAFLSVNCAAVPNELMESELFGYEKGGFTGANREGKADVRVSAATNRDLKAMIEQKQFRADLYYRLCVLPVEIPPLRERPLDIGALAWHFLTVFNRKHRQERELPTGMLDGLRSYSWQGKLCHHRRPSPVGGGAGPPRPGTHSGVRPLGGASLLAAGGDRADGKSPDSSRSPAYWRGCGAGRPTAGHPPQRAL